MTMKNKNSNERNEAMKTDKEKIIERFERHVERAKAMVALMTAALDQYTKESMTINLDGSGSRGLDYGHCGSLDQTVDDMKKALWNIAGHDDENEFDAFVEDQIDKIANRGYCWNRATGSWICVPRD